MQGSGGKRACERGHFKTTADRSREEKGKEMMCGVREKEEDGLRGYNGAEGDVWRGWVAERGAP